MWAITSYFNPARYKRRLANYKKFRANLGTPLVTVELSFDGTFELTKEDADILIQIEGGAVLWQKERLLNVALRAVPADERFIAWLDCDIIFGESNWVNLAEQSLAAHNAVQLFSDVLNLGIDDTGPARGDETRPATGHSFVKQLGANPEGAFAENLRIKDATAINRGLAWAARREIIDRHGFYDVVIAGKSDRAMAFGMYGRFDKFLSAIDCNEDQEQHYLKWALPFDESIQRRIGHLPGRGRVNWVYLTEQLLAAHNAIQLFSDLLYLDSGDTGPARGDETRAAHQLRLCKKAGLRSGGSLCTKTVIEKQYAVVE